MKTENQHFTVERIQLEKGRGYLFTVFDVGHAVKWSGLVVGNFESHRTVIIAANFEQLVETGHGAFPSQVNDKIAGDGKEPSLEAGLTVELGSPSQDPHPDFLKEIFGLFAIAGEEQEIAKKTVLITDDELIEKAWILTLEPVSDSEILLPDLFLGCGGGAWRKKRANGRKCAHHLY